jgi:acid phosphatase
MNKNTFYLASLIATTVVTVTACNSNDSSQSNAASTPAATAQAAQLSDVKNIVVIYSENHSFDDIYGNFPGANGLQNATASSTVQLDRNGTPLPTLPQIWGGLTAPDVSPVITQAMTAGLPNAPFAIDDPNGFNASSGETTLDMDHRFYENQMQIHGGKNDMFAAFGDSGAMVMGHYTSNPANIPLYKVAQKYVLADNFFMGAFGGSFLNHQWLICACIPTYPNADQSPAKTQISAVDPDNVSLTLTSDSPASALDGIPQFVNSGILTPDFFAVNTVEPPYQPSGNPPPAGGDPALADLSLSNTLVPQTQTTIGDLMSTANVSWAWYAGAWQAALDDRSVILGGTIQFQPHHHPFNFFKQFAPGTPARAQHLLDAGLGGTEFIKAIDTGTLPAVSFYKPQGNLNEHPGYANVADGEVHIADVIHHLENSPQWKNMVVIITYDENGGSWDHVAPPKGDRWGPGTRIPTLIVSPYAKMGTVDHTMYDTTSVLRLITERFNLPVLPGITSREAALMASGGKPSGDLLNALNLTK